MKKFKHPKLFEVTLKSSNKRKFYLPFSVTNYKESALNNLKIDLENSPCWNPHLIKEKAETKLEKIQRKSGSFKK